MWEAKLIMDGKNHIDGCESESSEGGIRLTGEKNKKGIEIKFVMKIKVKLLVVNL